MPAMHAEVQRIISVEFDRKPIEWIIAPKDLDEQLKSEPGDLVLKAHQNELDDWGAEPKSSLALVVLLDQLSRNIFRRSAEAFRGDVKTWYTITKSVARGFNKQVTTL